MKGEYSILFRTAGGSIPKKEIGFGHIFRCINLAKSLKKNNIHFLIEDYGSVKKILKKNQISNISVLKSGIKLEKDIEQTVNYIRKNQIRILIVDKYRTKKHFVNSINKIIPVICITDLKEKDQSCNLLINGFIGYENKIVRNKKTKLLLGPKYQILDPKFSKQKKDKVKYDILATFGGFDESKIFEYLLESLSYVSGRLSIRCILGVGTKNSQKLKNLQRNSKHKISIINQTSSMKREIDVCRFGLCSGGITTYEFAASKIPFAIISQNKHQLITANEWHKRKAGIDIGLPNKKNQKKLIKFLEDISRGETSGFSRRKFVDGNATSRISKYIQKIVQE